MKPKPYKIVPLKKRIQQADAELVKLVRTAQANVAARIELAAKNPRNASSASVREKAFQQVGDVYGQLALALDEYLKRAVAAVAEDAHAQGLETLAALPAKAWQKNVVVKFDPERIARYWGLVNPDNATDLSAVFTENMAKTTLRSLRGAVVDVFRQAQLEGWTAKTSNRELRDRWEKVAGEGVQFVDRAGQPWEQARYLQMLTRTTLGRVARESYADTLISAGEDLMQVVNPGEPCPICEAWQNVILSMSGADKRYPSYKMALAAGLFHPNCLCHLEGLVAAIHGEEIARQADIATPREIRPKESLTDYTRDVVAPYGEKVNIARLQAEQGLTAAEARTEYARETLRDRVTYAWGAEKTAQDAPRSDLTKLVDRMPSDKLAKLLKLKPLALRAALEAL